MASPRTALPRPGSDVYLADSGLETDLIFNHGIDLPEFASFVLLEDDDGRVRLREYFDAHLDIARSAGAGIVLETPTWRASRDWGERLGHDPASLDRLNRAAIDLLADVRSGAGLDAPPVVVSGNLGPRHDAYAPALLMSAAEAEDYHRDQVTTFADTAADVVSALTLTYAAEAIGIARAAADAEVPVVLAFTVETDGRLPDGTELRTAIASVDEATDGYPAYFMLNCAHPTHLDGSFAGIDVDESWTGRLGGLRANASRMSHAELDEATELDPGDPEELAREYAQLRERVPSLAVFGGCCGTDARHVEAIARAVVG
jgi:homocysteine S-methyltransferase